MKNLGLTYCTNVHPLGDFPALEQTLGFFGPSIRAKLGWRELPMGLWFPASLVEEIGRDPETLRGRIKSLLAKHDLSTFTCNAFPFGNFHDPVVKTKVYHPDWTQAARLDYTVACAGLLAALLPAGADGSVSTLPLGWRVGWSDSHSRAAAGRLCAWVEKAKALADRGHAICLGLEPEPGCALETTGQVLDFWDRHLRPAAAAAGLAEADLAAHCGVCYDTCHQAVQFEDPVAVLDRLSAHGISLAKMQLSSALEFLPDPERRSLALRHEFVEPRFLHQTKVKTPEGISAFDDLPEALAAPAAEAPWDRPWRVHFHVPIDAPALLDSAYVATTRGDMLAALHHALAKGLCRHFEVETYTWSVLPEAHRPADREALAACLARELRFIEDNVPAGTRLHA